MIRTNNTISQNMLEILRRCKGVSLDSLLYTDTGNNVKMLSMQIVVLRFEGFDVELWNEEQSDVPGELTDLAKIRISMNKSQNVKSPIGTKDENGVFIPLDFITLKVMKVIDRIKIYNENIKCFNSNGREVFELNNTRAIVVSLGDAFLHIEKQCSWSEMWDVSIKETESLEKSTEWENDEDTTYEVHQYSQEL